ncbi:MAG: hypothetical protein M3162_05620 [Thermoproteota archaeon]|nr:hypothetical protein [Thermoproteota archaeon]
MNKTSFKISPKYSVLLVLVSIVIVGLIGIPFGDPRFIVYAIFLELSYVALTVLVVRGSTKALYACIFLAILIIVGNSFVNAHINRITSFSKPLNTMVLIVGGYVLQALLIFTSVVALRTGNKSKSLLH